MKNQKLLGNSLLVLTAMIWGTAFVFQRVGMESIGPMTFTAARMALAAIEIGTLAWVLDRKKPPVSSPSASSASSAPGGFRPGAPVVGGILCGLFLVAGSLFQQIGLVQTSAGKAGFLTAMYIPLVPIIQFLLFRRKNPWLVWLAVLLGIAGMGLLCFNDGFRLTGGDGWLILCAFLFAGHILCCDRFARLGNPLTVSAVQFATAAAVAAVAALIAETPTLRQLSDAAIPILYCGMVSGGIGYTLQMVGQKFTTPTVASLLMSLESVFAVLAGSLFLKERLQLREWLGCAVIFVAILLVQIPLPARPSAKRSDGGASPLPESDPSQNP